LKFDPRKPPALNGNQGLGQKSAEPGNASYYYSITRMGAKGTLKLGGQEIPVHGLAWLDREWSTSMLADYQAGWDWFSLQLDDGTDLMYFRLRHKDGTDDTMSSGVLIAEDGQSTRLARDEVSIKALGSWESPAGGVYPSGWQLAIKPNHRNITVRPVLADQEFRHDARYWEGAVDVLDAATGRPLGRGYVELTGYAPGKVEKSGD
jgi:predicted secreted hydrolase